MVVFLQDFGADMVQGGHNGIELIDIFFALSNVKLVREIVQDNIRQLEAMNEISKGQNEGLKNMIMQKQRMLHGSLSDVEKMLQSIIEVNTAPSAKMAGSKNLQLNTDQSQALVGAIVFAINHMSKFVPGADMANSGGLPQSMI